MPALKIRHTYTFFRAVLKMESYTMKIPCMVIIDGLDTFAIFRCSEFAFFTTDFNANLSEVHQLLSTLILVLKVVFAGFDSFSPSIFSF